LLVLAAYGASAAGCVMRRYICVWDSTAAAATDDTAASFCVNQHNTSCSAADHRRGTDAVRRDRPTGVPAERGKTCQRAPGTRLPPRAAPGRAVSRSLQRGV